jgi:hypothetical protein
VEVLLENIPNELSSGERLMLFLELTHLDLNFVFDTGTPTSAKAWRRRVQRDEGPHPLHACPRQRRQGDKHLFPLIAEGGTIDWKKTMDCCARARTSIRCCWS